MVLSVFAYALVFGWPYAVGFVALLFIHEMGHYLAARRRSLNVGLRSDVRKRRCVPLLYPRAREAGSDLLMALAYAGFVLNLFNHKAMPAR